jgi:hypothetical protein
LYVATLGAREIMLFLFRSDRCADPDFYGTHPTGNIEVQKSLKMEYNAVQQ